MVDTRAPAGVGDPLLGHVEALLMAAHEPLSEARLVALLERHVVTDRHTVQAALQALARRYEAAAVDLVEVAGGWRFQVGAAHADVVAGLWQERPPKLSRALLETLALICYRQPAARSDVEQIRGVAVSSSIIKTLQEYDWIKVVGRREVPGRPVLYGTTRRFLDDFGVRQLADLPALPDIQDPQALEAALTRLQPDAAASQATTTQQTPQAPGACVTEENSSE